VRHSVLMLCCMTISFFFCLPPRSDLQDALAYSSTKVYHTTLPSIRGIFKCFNGSLLAPAHFHKVGKKRFVLGVFSVGWCTILRCFSWTSARICIDCIGRTTNGYSVSKRRDVQVSPKITSLYAEKCHHLKFRIFAKLWTKNSRGSATN